MNRKVDDIDIVVALSCGKDVLRAKGVESLCIGLAYLYRDDDYPWRAMLMIGTRDLRSAVVLDGLEADACWRIEGP